MLRPLLQLYILFGIKRGEKREICVFTTKKSHDHRRSFLRNAFFRLLSVAPQRGASFRLIKHPTWLGSSCLR